MYLLFLVPDAVRAVVRASMRVAPTMLSSSLTQLAVWWLIAGSCCVAVADDWPAYLHDRARSGVTAERLDTPLSPVWTFRPTASPRPAWTQPTQEADRVRFDDAFHVVVSGGRAFFGSSGDNKVYALDAATGQPLWTYFTDGPVRLAPTVWENKVYFGSDDGFAYCLNAADGQIVWKRRAADRDDRVTGHGRMISLWPVRSGVLVDGGVAYFAGGIFPQEGIFICAVDARDGKQIWRNDVTGDFGPQQQYDGVSPQGYLLATDSTLYVSSGRAMPAAFDRQTGDFLYSLNPGGKVGGAYALITGEHVVAGVNDQKRYDPQSGLESDSGPGYAWAPAHRLVVAGNVSYAILDHELTALDRSRYVEHDEKSRGIRAEAARMQGEVRTLWRSRFRLDDKAPDYQKKYDAITVELDATLANIEELTSQRREIESGSYLWRRPNDCHDALMLAGDVLLTGGEGRVNAYSATSGDWMWTGDVDGRAAGLAVADGRLYVSDTTGAIHCFAPGNPGFIRSRITPEVVERPYPEDDLSDRYRRAAQEIVDATGVTRGFCIVVGCGDGRLAYELARLTDLQIYAVDDNANDVARARRALDASGIYGTRVTVDHAPLDRLPYPDYCANLIVSDDVVRTGKLAAAGEEIYRILRPLGGVVWFAQPAGDASDVASFDADTLVAALGSVADETPIVSMDEGARVSLKRGPLAGAGAWTHQYANPANTANSGDERVKTPLGVLWFGSPGPERMVERHARAAAPVSMDGRLFVQGENLVMAYDAYNGALLWERDIPGAVRVRVDVDGSNMAVCERGLFVAARDHALRLDPATGATLQTYNFPSPPDGQPRRWGALYCVGDLLYGTTAPPLLEEYGARWQNPSDNPLDNLNAYRPFVADGGLWRNMQRWPDWGREDTWKGALTGKMVASDALVAFDIESGDVRWMRQQPIGHAAIAFGDGKLFLAHHEGLSAEERAAAIQARRDSVGELTDEDAAKDPESLFDVRRLVALDASTGVPLWERNVDLTACGGDKLGLVYVDKLLLVFGHFSNHDGSQFSKGGLSWRRVATFSADDGTDRWSKELNYLRRPLVIGTDLIVEPRAVDIRTGEYRKRYHPTTGEETPWEFKRGGHSCGICTGSGDTFFFRSDSVNYYDFTSDSGMLPVGAMRAGCWINMIACNGVALMPEASAGCTCSFPIRSTICMAPRSENRAWSIFAASGPLAPVQRWCINLGAPGDRRDDAGNVWFGYPRLRVGYGVQFDLGDEGRGEHSYFAQSVDAANVASTSEPWVFASGVRGHVKLRLPLLDAPQAGAKYTVRLAFCEPLHDADGRRLFDIRLQGETVATAFDVHHEAGGRGIAHIAEFPDIPVDGELVIELVPSPNASADEEMPLLNGVDVVRG